LNVICLKLHLPHNNFEEAKTNANTTSLRKILAKIEEWPDGRWRGSSGRLVGAATFASPDISVG